MVFEDSNVGTLDPFSHLYLLPAKESSPIGTLLFKEAQIEARDKASQRRHSSRFAMRPSAGVHPHSGLASGGKPTKSNFIHSKTSEYNKENFFQPSRYFLGPKPCEAANNPNFKNNRQLGSYEISLSYPNILFPWGAKP